MKENQNTSTSPLGGGNYRHPTPIDVSKLMNIFFCCKDRIELEEKLREYAIEKGEEFSHVFVDRFSRDRNFSESIHSFIKMQACSKKLNNHMQAEQCRRQRELEHARQFGYRMCCGGYPW